MTSIEEIVSQDPHVKAIHPAEEWDLKEVNYAWFDGHKDAQEAVEEAVEELQGYLNSPYIEDDFEDHSQRREWRDQMENKYSDFYDYYKTNTLKLNSIQRVISSIHFLKQYCLGSYPEFQELSDELINIAKASAREYDLKSIDEKIEFARQLKNKVYELLDCLAE